MNYAKNAGLGLLDVNTPRGVRAFSIGHEVRTAQEEGCHTMEHGELLRSAEIADFEVIVTCDQRTGVGSDESNAPSSLRSTCLEALLAARS